MKKNSQHKSSYSWWMYFVAVFAGFLIFRILLVNRALFFTVLIAAAIIVAVYFLYRAVREYQNRKAFKTSTKGKLHARIAYCEEHIKKFKKEQAEISDAIAQLESQLNQPFEIKKETKSQTERLIQSLRNEAQLRAAKIKFYRTCTIKLQSLEHNHQLSEQLNEKMEDLKRLRESNYEELADMESLKTQLQYEEGFFNTLDHLSLRLLKTESLSDTESLQKELETITKEL